MENNTTNLLNTLVGTGALREEVRSMLQQELRAALQAELIAVLGYEKGDPLGWGSGNNRNGEYHRKIDTEFGKLDIAVPREDNETEICSECGVREALEKFVENK